MIFDGSASVPMYPWLICVRFYLLLFNLAFNKYLIPLALSHICLWSRPGLVSALLIVRLESSKKLKLFCILQTTCTRRRSSSESVPTESHFQPNVGHLLHPKRRRHKRIPWLWCSQSQQGQGALGVVQWGKCF